MRSTKHTDTVSVFENPSVGRAVWTLAIPTVITQLINMIYNFADTWFVGRTGNAAMVAATNVCMPLFVIMAAIANLFGIGGASVISRALGQKKPEKARKVFAFCLYGGLAGAICYAVFIALARPVLISLVGGDRADYNYIYQYMFWTMIIGAIPTVGNVLCGHLVRSIGAAKEAGFGMSLGGILNCFLDPLFMFVILPPGNEVTGAAIATMLSNTAALVYFLIFLARHKDNPVFTMNPKDISFADRIPGDVLAVGIPAALQTTLAMVSNIFANALVVGYGTEAVAGMGVAKKINMIAFNTSMGMTQGVLPLIGYCYGAKNYKRLRKSCATRRRCCLFSRSAACCSLWHALRICARSSSTRQRRLHSERGSSGSSAMRLRSARCPTCATRSSRLRATGRGPSSCRSCGRASSISR